MAKVWTDVYNSVEPNQLASLTEKTTPVSADLLLVEDSEANGAKKKVQVGNLPVGAPNLTDAEFPTHAVSTPAAEYASENPTVNFATSNRHHITATTVSQITLQGVASKRAVTSVEIANGDTVTGVVSAGTIEWVDGTPKSFTGKCILLCHTLDGTNFTVDLASGIA